MKNKIVFIGNSIVNGFPMSRGRSFPGLVRAALKEGILPEGSGNREGKKAVPLYADVINKGANGETTGDILRRFRHDVLDHEPLAVFIMTGTNDFIYREAGPAQCLQNLEDMARQARKKGIVPVYMTPLPVDEEKASRKWMAGIGIDYRQINSEIGTFSEMIRGSGQLYMDSAAAWDSFLAGENGSIDMTDQPLRGEVELPANPGDAYLDGVHPTPEGHRVLAAAVLRWIAAHTEELGLA